VAELIGAHPLDVIFTSCATESNNAAIAAALQDFPANRPDGPKPSIFMSRTPIQSEDMRRKALYLSGQQSVMEEPYTAYALPFGDPSFDLSPRRTRAHVPLLELFGARLSWADSALPRFSLPTPDNLGLRVDGE
jgi:hypothetical protein